MKKVIILLVLLMLSFALIGQESFFNYDKVLRNNKAKELYKKKDVPNSQREFLKNSTKYPKDSNLHYNLGNAYYKNKQYKEAEKEYAFAEKLAKKNTGEYNYNIGNSLFQQKDYMNALLNYKKALMKDPKNEDARKNFELARQMLMSQQKQKQNQQKQDKKQEQKKEEQKKQEQDQNKKEMEKLFNQLNEKEKQDRKKEKKSFGGPGKGKFW